MVKIIFFNIFPGTSQRKQFRIRLRIYSILFVFFGTYYAAVYTALNNFLLAYFFGLLVLIGSIFEFVVNDILTEKNIQHILKRLGMLGKKGAKMSRIILLINSRTLLII